jgi:ribonucleoside-diphosphate reductase alpha chain
MKIERHYTKTTPDPYANIEFRKARSEIRHADGSVTVIADEIEVPANWSQVAVDILAQKYFRRTGVPKSLELIPEEDVPSAFWRAEALHEMLERLPERPLPGITQCRCG